jgi:hypothetical protein
VELFVSFGSLHQRKRSRAYGYSDELQRNVANGDVDSVEDRKGREDEILSLCKTSGYLPVSIGQSLTIGPRYSQKPLVPERPSIHSTQKEHANQSGSTRQLLHDWRVHES